MIDFQTFFIKYSNGLFQHNLEANLKPLLTTVMNPYNRDVQQAINIEEVFFRIIAFRNNPSLIPKIEKLIHDSDNNAVIWLNRISLESVYGYRGGYCEKRCQTNKQRKTVIGEEHFKGKHRLNCLECGQLYFKNQLREMIKKRNTYDVDGLESSLVLSRDVVAKHLRSKTPLLKVVRPSENAADYRLTPETFFKGLLTNRFLKVAYYGLLQHLEENNNNIEKIGLCEHCDMVYLKAKRNKKQKFCSVDCKEKFHRIDRVKSGYLNEFKKQKRKDPDCPISYL